MSSESDRLEEAAWVLPVGREGTIFDEFDPVFGPILGALQAGEFETAARLVGALTKRTGDVAARLEELRAVLRSESMSYGELAEWDAWVAGEVVGYVVRETMPGPSDTRGAVIDSCWGFYPDSSTDGSDGYGYVRQEARSSAESERDARATRARETRRGWAVARVPA